MTDKEKMIRRWSDCVREMESIADQVIDYSLMYPQECCASWAHAHDVILKAAAALEKLSKKIG